MSKKQTLQKEIRDQSDQDLRNFISKSKETLRLERFKDKFSRKAGTVRQAKRQVARAFTELTSRNQTK